MGIYGQTPTYKVEEQIKYKRKFCISLQILRQITSF